VSRENYSFAIGVPRNVTNYVRYLAVYLLQNKVTQMLRNVSTEERGDQTKYIGE